MAALKQIKVPVLRWPGGCFADEYHWKDGSGPRSQRPAMINTHWGGVVENNHFGTHEFLDLCQQLGCEPYLCGNLGSGSVQEMQQWVEYITFDGVSPMAELRKQNGHPEPWKLKFFAIGNENWGCGGNMTPDFYADQYRRYVTYLRNFGGNRIYKVACGPTGGNYHWTETLMQQAGRQMAGLALHYYWGSGKRTKLATEMDEGDWFAQLQRALQMEELVTRHSAIMDKYDPDKRVALIVDECGTWHQVEPGTNPGFLYQQNTLRDALVAGVTLNIFNNHCSRVKMANIAQMVNVLQAMILTDKEKMILIQQDVVIAWRCGADHRDPLPFDPLYGEAPETTRCALDQHPLVCLEYLRPNSESAACEGVVPNEELNAQQYVADRIQE